ncbi:hypothetical protein PAXRUDRAFT_833376 [Paxillus rubicundulus Ve08.2h10]|uniref:Secreted protein n=1 Tax=Paxillus rubicundulus Ve08.2h10 TaxID=930991 RepID=A0A0D0DH45_9AGAM|nr:hypothetical protein PAXRUDRAFT_833376 [Paxillus rubicundulus Ve08.2h10]
MKSFVPLLAVLTSLTAYGHWHVGVQAAATDLKKTLQCSDCAETLRGIGLNSPPCVDSKGVTACQYAATRPGGPLQYCYWNKEGDLQRYWKGGHSDVTCPKKVRALIGTDNCTKCR